MYCTRDGEKFFVLCIFAVLDHSFISILAKVIAVRLITVHNQYGTSDLIAVCKNRLIHKGLAAKTIPAFVRVKASRMVASALVVFAVILYKEWSIFRYRKWKTSAGS